MADLLGGYRGARAWSQSSRKWKDAFEREREGRGGVIYFGRVPSGPSHGKTISTIENPARFAAFSSESMWSSLRVEGVTNDDLMLGAGPLPLRANPDAFRTPSLATSTIITGVHSRGVIERSPLVDKACDLTN
jgi:hypothetical protein